MKKWGLSILALTLLLINSISYSMNGNGEGSLHEPVTTPIFESLPESQPELGEDEPGEPDEAGENREGQQPAPEAALVPHPAYEDALSSFHRAATERRQAGEAAESTGATRQPQPPRSIAELLSRPPSEGFDRILHNEQEALYYEVATEELPVILANTSIQIAPKKLKQLLGAMRSSHLKSIKLLFVGEPGTGKSTVALAIAQKLKRKLGFDYKLFDTTQMAGEVRNSGERNLKTAFLPILAANEHNRWVAILEELDKFVAPQYIQEKSVGTALALNMILNQCLRNPNIVIIGITNHSDVFPEALKSRFKEIEFLLPGKDERYLIIECSLRLLEQKGFEVETTCFDKTFLKSVASYSNGMTIRNIEDALGEIVENDETDQEIAEEEKWWMEATQAVQGAAQTEEGATQAEQGNQQSTRARKKITQATIWTTLKRNKPPVIMPLIWTGLGYIGATFRRPIVSNILAQLAVLEVNQIGTNLNIRLMESGKWSYLAQWLPWFAQAQQARLHQRQDDDYPLTQEILMTTARDASDAVARQKEQLRLAEKGSDLGAQQFLYLLWKELQSGATFSNQCSFTKESLRLWIKDPKNVSLLVRAAPFPIDERIGTGTGLRSGNAIYKSDTGQLEKERKQWHEDNLCLGRYLEAGFVEGCDVAPLAARSFSHEFWRQLEEALK